VSGFAMRLDGTREVVTAEWGRAGHFPRCGRGIRRLL